MPRFRYPAAPRSEQHDNYHGTLVPDPYRWLEDSQSPNTRAWIMAQNALTFDYLESIPQRERLQERLKALWDYPKATAPLRRGDRYFQFRNSGLQNQDVLYSMDQPDGPGRMLLDPNQLSAEGTTALNNWAVSPDGSLLAYATSQSGSDWQTWRVRRVSDNNDLEDVIEWSKFSDAAWLPDASGFYYARYAAPEPGSEFAGTNYHQKVYLHLIGTSQEQDLLIYERPDHKTWGFNPLVTADGRFLVLHVSEGTDIRNRLFYRDLHTGGEFVELISELEAAFELVDSDGATLYLATTLDAPRQRLIAVDTRQPQREHWRTIIPESRDRMEHVILAGDQFVAAYLHNAYSRLERFDLQGNSVGEIELPGLGAIQSYAYELSLHGQRKYPQVFFTFASFVIPPTVYHYHLQSGELQVLFQPNIDFDFSAYVTRQEFATHPDGTRIPIFITHSRDLEHDHSNPTLLYGYGGFDISLTPAFTVHRLAWLEMGGVFAQAVLRGGGEYGENWHQAGMRTRKQNVFNDFILCAEHLAASGLTAPPKLAIEGRSNGGLLVGACLTQRPELFGAALPAVGVLDMLRFHKFTIGWAWTSDYGSPDDPEEFNALFAYSPLHNIREGTRYPATLITTADHDDRVVPAHSFKFAAALQAAQSGDAPILIRIQTQAGHGFGKPTRVIIEEQADIYAFLVRALDIQLD